MRINEAVDVLKSMKEYYNNDENIGNGFIFDLRDNEAIDKAIKVLEQKGLKGYTHQNVDRELFKEIMTDAEKMRAFVHLQSAITNFIAIIGDIDIQIDLQPKGGQNNERSDS